MSDAGRSCTSFAPLLNLAGEGWLSIRVAQDSTTRGVTGKGAAYWEACPL